MLILNGIIHTMDGETIDSGFVQVKGTRIQEVGHMSQLPPGAELDQVIDARGGHVLPGLPTSTVTWACTARAPAGRGTT